MHALATDLHAAACATRTCTHAPRSHSCRQSTTLPEWKQNRYTTAALAPLVAEFDPYFNYRVTRFLTKEGFYNMWNWFDDRTWYPLGRVVGGTLYPVRFCRLNGQLCQ